jgi:hypothetical protein
MRWVVVILLWLSGLFVRMAFGDDGAGLYKGRPGPVRAVHERQRWFRRQQRWRSGQEATISLGSRKYEWRRSRLRGRDGAHLWIGFGILTYNLDRIVTIGVAR